MLLLLLGVGLCTGAKVEMEGEGCHDGYLDCSSRAELCRAENYNQLLQMMTHCRQTCKQFLENKVGSTSLAGTIGINTIIDKVGFNCQLHYFHCQLSIVNFQLNPTVTVVIHTTHHHHPPPPPPTTTTKTLLCCFSAPCGRI